MSDAEACVAEKMSGGNPYNRLLKAAERQRRPWSCHFEITYRCNHTCPYCYNAIDPRHKELSTEECLRVINMMADFGTLYVCLTGGEPLLRSDFFTIAEEAKRRHMALRIYTNGFLIDGAMADRLKKLNPVEFGISIHGADGPTHDRETRVRGSFEKTIRGVRELKKRGLHVILKTPLTHLNQHQARDIHDLAVSLGCPILIDPIICVRDDGNQDPLQYKASEDFLRRWFSEEYADCRVDKTPWRRNLDAEESNCNAGAGRYAVDPYGYIYPCVTWRQRIANVRDIRSFKELWATSPVVEEVLDVTRRIPREFLKSHDIGPYTVFCPGQAHKETGSAMKFYPAAELQARIRKEAFEPLLERVAEPLGEGN